MLAYCGLGAQAFNERRRPCGCMSIAATLRPIETPIAMAKSDIHICRPPKFGSAIPAEHKRQLPTFGAVPGAK